MGTKPPTLNIYFQVKRRNTGLMFNNQPTVLFHLFGPRPYQPEKIVCVCLGIHQRNFTEWTTMNTSSFHIDQYDLSGVLVSNGDVSIPVIFTLSVLWINKDRTLRKTSGLEG